MASTVKTPRPKLDEATIYLGDNGRCFCGGNNGRCAGSSAYFTGRDLSGQRVEAVSPEDDDVAFREYGVRLKCEGCSKGVSRIVAPFTEGR
jgi:hypothetical protein